MGDSPLTDERKANLDLTSNIYPVEDKSSVKVKKEPENLEEEISFKCSSSPSNILKSPSEIKEEIRDHDCVDIKEEPLNVDQEHGTEASILDSSEIKEKERFDNHIKEEPASLEEKHDTETFNFEFVGIKEEESQDDHIGIKEELSTLDEVQDVKIKEEKQDVVEPFCERLSMPDVPLTEGQEKLSKAIEYGVKSDQPPHDLNLPSNDTHGRLAHGFLPPSGVISSLHPQNAEVKHKEAVRSLVTKKSSSSPTRRDVLPPVKSLVAAKKKPYKCPTCHKGFTYKLSMEKHQRKQTCKKHFSCKVCQHTFTYKFILTRHMRIHTGRKAEQVLCVFEKDLAIIPVLGYMNALTQE